MNATYLFESNDTPWPACSESFWITLFALFSLHIGSGLVPRSRLTIWQCTNAGDGKWYRRRTNNPTLDLISLKLDAITVEPGALSKPWPGVGIVPPPEAGGFSPDLVMKTKAHSGGDHFVIIENKVKSGACLMDNQIENYPRLAAWLTRYEVSFDLLLLKSVGCSGELYKQAQLLQDGQLGSRFGILLWEEVLREMSRTKFAPLGLAVDKWQTYTAALDTDCVQV